MSFKRYNKVLGLLTATALGVVASFNLAADPYGAYRSVHWKALAEKSNSVGTRTARAELLRRGDWEFIVLGSSRAQMGYAPDHPALAGMRACNAAIPGTNMRELQPIVEYALAHNKPKRMLFAIDFLLFTSGRDFNQDFAQSRFAPGRDLISYHLDNTISLRTTYASVQQLIALLRKEPTRFTPLGQTVRHTQRVSQGHRALFEAKLYEFFTNPESYANFEYSQDRLDRFAEIIRAARQAGVEMDIVINPVHAAQLEAIEVAGLWPVFEQWLADLVSIVDGQRNVRGPRIRLVSFLSYEPYCDEPIPPPGDTQTSMVYWWESSHFRAELGNIVLDELYGSPPPDRVRFGLELTSDNLAGHIAALNSGNERWSRAHPDDAALVRQVARRAGIID